MQRLKKNCSLFEIEPALIKEWHPSANGRLTPRKVTVGYPEKVWWICEDGHEWQATIKCRLKGKDCPVCKIRLPEKEPDRSGVVILTPINGGQPPPPNPRNSEIDPDGEYVAVNTGKNFRKGKRFRRKAIAVLEVPGSGHWLYAEMKNISRRGLCFETEAAFRPGTAIKIKFDKSIVSTDNEGYQSCDSIVRWCKRLDEDDASISTYGCGVQFIGTN